MSSEFDEDAGDRLIKLLVDKHLTCTEQLKPAARMAGQQLELLKPGMMAVTNKGPFIGSVAHVERGMILIILANARRVITVTFPNTPDLLNIVDSSATAMQDEWQKAIGRELDLSGLLELAVQYLKMYGAAPGKSGREVPQEATYRLFGLLFAVIPVEARTEIISALQTISSEDVCPAAVLLIGKGSSGRKGTFSGVWPLMLALAPYVETIPE